MRMICEDCHHVFDEEEAGVGKMLFPGSEVEPPEYDDMRCPECGSEDIEESALCPICGEYYRELDGDICKNCQSAIVEAIDDLAEKMADGDVQDAKDAIVAFVSEVMA